VKEESTVWRKQLKTPRSRGDGQGKKRMEAVKKGLPVV
jgi:hypothetical protein